ncbi:MAG TPA: hypothetical protein VGM75_04725, partial [Pseudonocardiaceae bacterium]
TAAIRDLRRLIERSPERNTICPPGLQHHWTAISTGLRARFLRAGDPDRGPIDRLRYRSCTPCCPALKMPMSGAL